MKIYSRRTSGQGGNNRGKEVEEGLSRGDETILVVEDDEEVRKVTARILRMQGYSLRSIQ
jgi:PleD family two-component response regulator